MFENAGSKALSIVKVYVVFELIVTFIIGLISGVLGILITLVLNVPISMVVENMTGVAHIAKLPVNGAVFLILIDLVLTILAGLIPSKIASKKDPVEALRSE